MRQSVRLGRVAGIPVGAHWSVAVILALIAEMLGVSMLPAAFPHRPAAAYWGVAVVAALAFAGSLLAHELAHALVARRNGIAVRSVTLWMLGGVTELEGNPASPGADLRVALAGPAASLLTGSVFVGIAYASAYAGLPGPVAAAAMWLALMNGVLAVFNLLPGAPLDGGRVLRAALWRHWGDRTRAERGAARAGRAIGLLIALSGVAEALIYGLLDGLWLVLIGWFMVSAAAAEETATTASAALGSTRVSDVMLPDPQLAPGWLTAAAFVESLGAHPAQTAFPVVDWGGDLVGLVTIAQLGNLPRHHRPVARLDQVALRVPAAYLARPDDPAAPLLTRRPLGGEVAAIVLAGRAIVGLVTAADLKRSVRWRQLATTGR